MVNFAQIPCFFQDFLGDKHEVEVILCFHYLICMLLPVLKQINQDQNDELEIEARIRGSVSYCSYFADVLSINCLRLVHDDFCLSFFF